MSGYVTGLVLRNSSSKGAARLVMAVIAEAADDDGTNAWPSMQTIADRANITRRAAQLAVTACQKAGELIVEEHKGGPTDRQERYRTHRYAIPIKGWIIAEGDRARGEQVTPLPEQGANKSTSKGRNPRQIRGEHSTPYPSLDPSLDPSPSKADDKALGFDQFWDMYPERDGKKLYKAATLTEWKKLDLETKRAAWRGAVNYRRAVDVQERRAKDPHRWLKDRLWEDWQDPPSGGVREPRRPSGGDPRRRGGMSLAEQAKQLLEQEQHPSHNPASQLELVR